MWGLWMAKRHDQNGSQPVEDPLWQEANYHAFPVVESSWKDLEEQYGMKDPQTFKQS